MKKHFNLRISEFTLTNLILFFLIILLDFFSYFYNFNLGDSEVLPPSQLCSFFLFPPLALIGHRTNDFLAFNGDKLVEASARLIGGPAPGPVPPPGLHAGRPKQIFGFLVNLYQMGVQNPGRFEEPVFKMRRMDLGHSLTWTSPPLSFSPCYYVR